MREQILFLLKSEKLSMSAIVKKLNVKKFDVEKEMKIMAAIGLIRYAGGRTWEIVK